MIVASLTTPLVNIIIHSFGRCGPMGWASPSLALAGHANSVASPARCAMHSYNNTAAVESCQAVLHIFDLYSRVYAVLL